MKEAITILFEIIIWSFLYLVITGHLTVEDARFICLFTCIIEILDKLNKIERK